MHVLLLHNAPTLKEDDPAFYSDYQVVDAADAVAAALGESGHRVSRLALGADSAALADSLHEHAPDIVFNLFEGLASDPRSEWKVAAQLERSGVPFTGCPSQALKLGGAKHTAKRLLARAGLHTPRFAVVRRTPAPAWPFAWPAIVKPGFFDASLGIDSHSVVANERELALRAEWLLQRFGPPVVVEEFVFGREFSLTLIESTELRCLPPREFRFDAHASLPWPILTYAAKWEPDSDEYQATPVACLAGETDLSCELMRIGKSVFRLFGCRDYARVDVRVDDRDRIHILEINPNPDMTPAGGLAGYLAAGLLDYGAFVNQLAINAVARAPRCQPPRWRAVACPAN